MAAFVLEHGRLGSVGVRGYAMIPDGLPLDAGVIGRAVRTSAAQLVLDVSEDPDFVEVTRATVSELSAPLLMPTGLVGVLTIETSVALPAGSGRTRASQTGFALPKARNSLLVAMVVASRPVRRILKPQPRDLHHRAEHAL